MAGIHHIQMQPSTGFYRISGLKQNFQNLQESLFKCKKTLIQGFPNDFQKIFRIELEYNTLERLFLQ